MGKENYDAIVRSYGELSKNFQAIAARWTDYSKRAFEDATRAFEQSVGAKSLEQAFEKNRTGKLDGRGAKDWRDVRRGGARRLQSAGTGPGKARILICVVFYGCSEDPRVFFSQWMP